ncbi:MAG: hypothetical protein RJQ09_16505 [Cyclobacteriaceae bacterium]
MRIYTTILLTLSICPLLAQEADSLLLDDGLDYSILEDDMLLLDELDSLSIFTLIDSILNADYKKSRLALRLGFTTDVVNAGRDLGANQQGLTPGLSFYHKSGMFVSALGYWNSQFDPKYNLTVLSGGYFGSALKHKLTYSASFERTFYHESGETVTDNDLITEEIENPFTNAIGLNLQYDFKYFYTGLDYSFFFGSDQTHRLRWNVTGYLKKKNFLFFDYLLFSPDFSLLFGQEDITLTTFNLREQLEQIDRQQLLMDLASLGFTRETFQQLRPAVKEELLRSLIAPESSVFGLMNYSFSAPFTFRKGKWAYTMSYNYNIPVELPGEDLDLSSSGYLGVSLTYYLSF